MTTNTVTMPKPDMYDRLTNLYSVYVDLEVAVEYGKPKAATLARIAALALEWLEEERGIGD